MLFGLLAVLFGVGYLRKTEKWWYAIAAGACIGLIGLTRPQNVIMFAVPLAIALPAAPKRRVGLVWLGSGGLPFLIILLAFNSIVHGDPLLNLNGLEVDGPPTHSDVTTPLSLPSRETIGITVHFLVLLYTWTSPVLLFSFMVAFIALLWQGRTDFSDWIMPKATDRAPVTQDSQVVDVEEFCPETPIDQISRGR
jgi:hypothetical protein